MKRHAIFRHEFVESFPTTLEVGVVYISMQYATITHQCACGCGNEVVTPLSPTDWQLYFDGISISLSPSIGNWNFACRSHYFIRQNRVQWARQWTQTEVDAGRKRDLLAKEQYFGEDRNAKAGPEAKRPGRWRRFLERFL
ncbi:MAG: DUF6527 family protein [Acidobacteria bacterium]|nr:DUF6527 family protein [Acidobacteriota bacterium]